MVQMSAASLVYSDQGATGVGLSKSNEKMISSCDLPCVGPWDLQDSTHKLAFDHLGPNLVQPLPLKAMEMVSVKGELCRHLYKPHQGTRN
jgi:hypothetical protein